MHLYRNSLSDTTSIAGERQEPKQDKGEKKRGQKEGKKDVPEIKQVPTARKQIKPLSVKQDIKVKPNIKIQPIKIIRPKIRKP